LLIMAAGRPVLVLILNFRLNLHNSSFGSCVEHQAFPLILISGQGEICLANFTMP
jgi:hypothetical protein